jgi:pimeloyl-ACP methyl ester carboxylesterase
VISVVTVHGLWMRGASMRALRRRLEPHGFAVSDFTYPSVTGSLAANVTALAAHVEALEGDTVHLVGHSLGGVLICALLESARPARIGRVVCLGSPLRGSRTAAKLARLPGGRLLVGRCLADVHARNGFNACRAGVEVGSIAGRLPLGVGRLFGPFPEPNDGTVAVAETLIDGLADHVVLPVSHVALLWSAHVADQVSHFLAHGRFRHAFDAGSSTSLPG